MKWQTDTCLRSDKQRVNGGIEGLATLLQACFGVRSKVGSKAGLEPFP